MSEQRHTMTIEIDNLTDAQVMAIEDMMATWQMLGGMGGSRWTSFYADGDGNFRPKITVDGAKAEFCDLVDRDKAWEGDEYRIDFDEIAWKLHDD